MSVGFPRTMWVIENWSVTSRDDPDLSPYLAPECRTVSIVGCCPNRPGFERGLVTSPVKRVEGRRVFTVNGSRYVLGKPNPGYVEHCRAKGWHVPTHKHPLRLIQDAPRRKGPKRDAKGRFVRMH